MEFSLSLSSHLASPRIVCQRLLARATATDWLSFFVLLPIRSIFYHLAEILRWRRMTEKIGRLLFGHACAFIGVDIMADARSEAAFPTTAIHDMMMIMYGDDHRDGRDCGGLEQPLHN